MKTFEALYIDENGVVRYIPECPEEPQNICRRCKGKGWIAGAEYPCGLCNPGGEWRSSKSSIQRYSEALAAAKQSAIEVQDQEQGRYIIYHELKSIATVTNTIHPLPTGWKVEVKTQYKPANTWIDCTDEIYQETYNSAECDMARKVAILTPDPIPDSGKKVESQEELWKAVSSEINEEGLWLYDDWDGFKLTSKGFAYLMKQFTITRKQ